MAALRQVLEEPFDLIVTMDGDGQHRPVDIPKLVERWSAGAGVVLGQRDMSVMSSGRRWGNHFISEAVQWFYPAAPLDTQCGLRA